MDINGKSGNLKEKLKTSIEREKVTTNIKMLIKYPEENI